MCKDTRLFCLYNSFKKNICQSKCFIFSVFNPSFVNFAWFKKNGFLLKAFIKTGFLFALLFILISGCSVRKYVNKNEHLIKSYKIDIEGKYDEISRSELKTFLKPKPNTKTIFFRTKLYNYYRYQQRKTKFRSWLYSHFGEEPAYYNTLDVDLVVKNMDRYLNNIGFFNSKITYQVKFTNKMAKVMFVITPSIPFKIESIQYDIADTQVKRFLFDDL